MGFIGVGRMGGPMVRRLLATRNVQANPQVLLRVGGETLTGDIEMVSDEAEMTRVVGLLKNKCWLTRPYLWLKGKPDGAFRVRVNLMRALAGLKDSKVEPSRLCTSSGPRKGAP